LTINIIAIIPTTAGNARLIINATETNTFVESGSSKSRPAVN
jgi:hypothetical protein